jgi:hypothetical protein
MNEPTAEDWIIVRLLTVMLNNKNAAYQMAINTDVSQSALYLHIKFGTDKFHSMCRQIRNEHQNQRS